MTVNTPSATHGRTARLPQLQANGLPVLITLARETERPAPKPDAPVAPARGFIPEAADVLAEEPERWDGMS